MKAKLNSQNLPKVPVTRALGLFWGTVFVFQMLSSQPQGANGISCYECIYSPDNPNVTVQGHGEGVNAKCLDPDKDGAPSKVCTAPKDKSCAKEARTYKFENGTVFFHMIFRYCSDHHIDRHYELCSDVNTEKESHEFSRAGQVELKRRGAGKKSSALHFKSRSKRETLILIRSWNTCSCDRIKTPNCNNEPGMKATSSAPFRLPPPFQLTTLLPLLLLVYSTVRYHIL